MKTAESKLNIVGGDSIIWGINKHINPRKDVKYSPNLYRFLTYKKKVYTNIFQDPETGYYYIGLRVPAGWWMGTKLNYVFGRGGKAECFSYATSVTVKWNDVTKWFWENYLKHGKQIRELPEWEQRTGK